MIKTRSLSYAYPDGSPIAFPDLSFEAGAQGLILGSSGSGKTTLLHLLAGLISVQQGEISIDGKDLGSLSQAERDRFRGQHIGIIFQKTHFVRSLSVGKNLQLAQYFAGLKQEPRKVKELLERLHLGHKYDAKPDRLSQGEQQRAGIARALLNQPKLILADEPTSALDDENASEVIGLLRQQAEQLGTTLLIVTHDQRLKDRFSHRTDLQAQTNAPL